MHGVVTHFRFRQWHRERGRETERGTERGEERDRDSETFSFRLSGSFLPKNNIKSAVQKLKNVYSAVAVSLRRVLPNKHSHPHPSLPPLHPFLSAAMNSLFLPNYFPISRNRSVMISSQIFWKNIKEQNQEQTLINPDAVLLCQIMTGGDTASVTIYHGR